jgi:glycerol uptake facilitator protein
MNQLVGEIFGTMLLIILGDGVVANVLLSKTKGQGLSGGWPSSSGWIVITAGWCFGVMAGVFTAAATGSPQADLNPAVTIAKLIHGGTTANDAVLRIIGEFIGAFLGGVVVWLAYFQHFGETQDKGLKLAVFCTAPNIRNYAMNVITEIIGTFTLVFVIFAIFSKAATGAGPASGVGPYLVAALVWGIGLSLGGPTGYAINPARDLGPRISHFVLPIAGKGDSDWAYSWVPVVGPIIGGIIAAVLAAAIGI